MKFRCDSINRTQTYNEVHLSSYEQPRSTMHLMVPPDDATFTTGSDYEAEFTAAAEIMPGTAALKSSFDPTDEADAPPALAEDDLSKNPPGRRGGR